MSNINKSHLVKISTKILKNERTTPDEISEILKFELNEKDNSYISFLKRYAVPLSLALGAIIAIFAAEFAAFTSILPEWTNLSPRMLAGLNYLWSIIGDPVDQENILYHLPNIFLYGFGIIGIKSLIDSINHKTWLEKVLLAQSMLRENISNGNLNLKMPKGHSLLFVGHGDFIGAQLAIDQGENKTVVVSAEKPQYTNIWNKYDIATQYENLKVTIEKCDAKSAGEYIFFPVKDDQVFLPNETAYDLSPHKLDIICQNIRNIERDFSLEEKRIIIIGDKFHKSFVLSEDQEREIENSEDVISLESITTRYKNITLLDPSDIVLNKIIEIAGGRKIIFRATKDGINEYKKRFYDRLFELGYKQNENKKGILTIGYDLSEDQTEQQTLHKKDDYFPVVLSKDVRDGLIRNGYKDGEYLYVPEIVLTKLSEIADEQ
jgi:hypothetical protein